MNDISNKVIIFSLSIILLFIVFNIGKCSGYNEAIVNIEKSGIELKSLINKMNDLRNLLNDMIRKLEEAENNKIKIDLSI
jgi:hypothetical protein